MLIETTIVLSLLVLIINQWSKVNCLRLKASNLSVINTGSFAYLKWLILLSFPWTTMFSSSFRIVWRSTLSRCWIALEKRCKPCVLHLGKFRSGLLSGCQPYFDASKISTTMEHILRRFSAFKRFRSVYRLFSLSKIMTRFYLDIFLFF